MSKIINKSKKRVLGLDIGSNSVGFSLLDLYFKNNTIIFDDIVSNSIVFSEPTEAKDRREARGARRRNERKSARKKATRRLYVKYKLADKNFIQHPSKFLNVLDINDTDVYRLREKAVSGKEITKDEFVFCTYSILTDRGYSNMFSTSNEDGIINEAVIKNSEVYKSSGYKLPSMVLTQKREEKIEYQNFPIRNKKDDYQNSLDRSMHKEEFERVVSSQKENKDIFKTPKQCQEFIDEMLDESTVNSPFYQRPLRSFEDMVEYCTFYNAYHPKFQEKRVPLSHIKNIELTIRQKIDNYDIKNPKTGEVFSFSKEEIDKIIDFWLLTPNANEISAKNIFKNAGFKDLALSIPEKSSQVVLDIKAYRGLLEVLKKYKIDFTKQDYAFYNEMLLVLYYFKNHSSRVEKITILCKKYKVTSGKEFIDDLAYLENMDGFASFSLKFTDEVLTVMRDRGKTHHEALESLGYFSKYIDMPVYDYLPPLNPTKADIEWLEKNLPYFQEQHLFYQPMISPKVRRVIAVLRKLINELISKHGKIDEIRIETAKELNSKKEKEKIDENQKNHRAKNNEAKRFLENKKIKKTKDNIDIAKLLKEQGGICFYSGLPITEDEAFDENITEVEHFIPRSTIWINSYKNKILVKKKYNQNKLGKHPIEYLKSIGQWEDFKGRVKRSFIDKDKKVWLTDEELINNLMNKEGKYWEDKYLNDTRGATRTVQKYLNHYLYPKKLEHGKDSDRTIFSVSGRAIHELKYMWGIHTIMPKDGEDKKDRNTNYHHTIDAFTVALCSNEAIQALHSYFIKKENKYKIKAMRENISSSLPISKDDMNVVEHLKALVKRYENNELYVCPYSKRKTNMKGFKDGNLKLYITNDKKDKEILAEMEKVAIDKSLLVKRVGLNTKDRSDEEVKKEIQSIQGRLDPQKQQKIIDAIDIYAQNLLDLRGKIVTLGKEIKDIESALKNGKKYKEQNDKIREESKPLRDEKNLISKQIEDLRCSFTTKNGKQQIVRSLKLYKKKIEKSKADVIIYQAREKDKIERLNVQVFKDALREKEPFVAKMNETTLNVELFDTKSRGQAVGLNYFPSLTYEIATKVNKRYLDEITSNSKSNLMLYKNDIIKVEDLKLGVINYYIFNGGGDVAGTNNKLSIKNINLRNFVKMVKGKEKELKEDTISPGKNIVVSKVKIDFFGNILEI